LSYIVYFYFFVTFTSSGGEELKSKIFSQGRIANAIELQDSWHKKCHLCLRFV